MMIDEEGVSQFLDRVSRAVAENGYTCIAVADHHPVYTYTVGASATCGYELLVLGLAPPIAHRLLHGAVQLGKKIEPDLRTEELLEGGLPVMFKLCMPSMAVQYAKLAITFYGDDVKVLQLVLPDHKGRLYGDPGYDLGPDFQPTLWKKYVMPAPNRPQ